MSLLLLFGTSVETTTLLPDGVEGTLESGTPTLGITYAEPAGSEITAESGTAGLAALLVAAASELTAESGAPVLDGVPPPAAPDEQVGGLVASPRGRRAARDTGLQFAAQNAELLARRAAEEARQAAEAEARETAARVAAEAAASAAAQAAAARIQADLAAEVARGDGDEAIVRPVPVRRRRRAAAVVPEVEPVQEMPTPQVIAAPVFDVARDDAEIVELLMVAGIL